MNTVLSPPQEVSPKRRRSVWEPIKMPVLFVGSYILLSVVIALLLNR